jgi:hypothetical protein
MSKKINEPHQLFFSNPNQIICFSASHNKYPCTSFNISNIVHKNNLLY